MSALIEGLEGRKLLAASAELVGQVLFVRGDLLAANEIEIENDASDPTKVDVKVKYTPEGGSEVVFEQEFNAADFVLLKVRGGIRGDLITIGDSGNPYTGNTRINGVSGNDTINGGAGSDRIAGGRGNDLIFGNGGHDRLHGEDGSDSLYGGAGHDVLWGGRGNDLADGGEGNDVLGGVLGDANTLVGGLGNDRFVIKEGGQAQATDFNADEDLFRIVGTGQGDITTPPTA
jgi:Ca2+-binding RTX toxin-like protein